MIAAVRDAVCVLGHAGIIAGGIGMAVGLFVHQADAVEHGKAIALYSAVLVLWCERGQSKGTRPNGV